MLGAVQTTGVNVEALAATLGPLLAILGALGRWLASRQDRHHDELADLQDRHHAENSDRFSAVQERLDSINTNGSLPMQGLSRRLDTIESHLERQDNANRALGERVARLEGPVRRAAVAAEAAAAEGRTGGS